MTETQNIDALVAELRDLANDSIRVVLSSRNLTAILDDRDKLAAENATLGRDITLLRAAPASNAKARRRIRRVSKFDPDKAAAALSKALQVAKHENGLLTTGNAALRARLAEAEEAAQQACNVLDEHCDNLCQSHTIRYPQNPRFGELTDEGKEQVAPYERALSAIRAFLANAPAEKPDASPPRESVG